MEFSIHAEALIEFKEFDSEVKEFLKQEIDKRKKRRNSITEQRGTGLCYDNHGEPIYYFKAENEKLKYRVFFDIKDETVIILGFRPREDDTYLNLREISSRL